MHIALEKLMGNVKKISIIAFTLRGANLCGKILELMKDSGRLCEAYTMPRFLEYGHLSNLRPLETDLSSWTKEVFSQNDAIIFISAAGIAVRAIAPYVNDKMTDPCVISIDEFGNYAIPLLSGHVGGGNGLALEIAELIGAQALISTATDLNHKFAIDEWAKKQHLHISNRVLAKKISASILDGDTIGFKSEFPIEGILPEEFQEVRCNLGVYLGFNQKRHPFLETLYLIPKTVTLGIGCRKGIDADTITNFVENELFKIGLPIGAVESVATIDLKANEAGLNLFCKRYNIPLYTYTAKQLMNIKGTYTTSEFVYKTVGVDNVCERSAVCCSGGGLILSKQKGNGVTIAAAARIPVIQW